MDGAIQDTLFPMPAAAPVAELSWDQKFQQLGELGKARGGLIPRSAVHEVLGVSKTRVYQLCDEGMLEVIMFFGVAFVSGRSIKAVQEEDRHKGRGHKVTRWEAFKVGAQLGKALADIAIPD